MEVGQLEVVQAHQVQDRRVNIVDVGAILDGIQADFVGRADGLSSFDAAPRHPHREPGRVMVAPTTSLLTDGGSAEFGPPDDQGVFEQAGAFQVGQ